MSERAWHIVSRIHGQKNARKATCDCRHSLFTGRPTAASATNSHPYPAQRHPHSGRLLDAMVRPVQGGDQATARTIAAL
jgi:hypothetical protein